MSDIIVPFSDAGTGLNWDEKSQPAIDCLAGERTARFFAVLITVETEAPMPRLVKNESAT